MGDTSWFEGAESPGAGDLGQMQALQHNLAAISEAAQTAGQDLDGLKNHVTDAIWRSDAAKEFRDDIDSKFLKQLSQLHESYQDAADGFTAYIAAVHDIKGRADSLASQIYPAQTNYESATRALAAWAETQGFAVAPASGSYKAPAFGDGSVYTVDQRSVVTLALPVTTTAGASPDPHAAAQAQAAATAKADHVRLQGAVHSAWTAMQGLYTKMNNLKETDRKNADHAVIHKLKDAHNAGMKNDSWWHHVWSIVSEVGKWAAIVIAVVAVIAVCVLAPELGIMGALAYVSTVGGIGSVVLYGGAIASGISVVGDLGQKFSGDGSWPGWTSLGISAFGMIPGFGKAGDFISALGSGGKAFTEGFVGLADTLRLRGAEPLDYLTGKLAGAGKYVSGLGKLTAAGSKFLVTLGANTPVDSTPGAVIWAGLKGNSIRKGIQGIIGATSGGTSSGPSTPGPDPDLRNTINQLNTTDPATGCKATQIANNLSNKTPTYTYPPQVRYPQSLPVGP